MLEVDFLKEWHTRLKCLTGFTPREHLAQLLTQCIIICRKKVIIIMMHPVNSL